MTNTTTNEAEATYVTTTFARVRMGDRLMTGEVVESVEHVSTRRVVIKTHTGTRLVHGPKSPIRIVTSYMTRHGFKLYRAAFKAGETTWVSIPE